MTLRNTRWIQAAVIPAALALSMDVAAETYEVTTLQGLGGGAGANSINDRGWIAGQANKPGDTVSRAALWIGGPVPLDLGSLGGPETNSAVAWPVKNNGGVIVGISDTLQDNPLAPLQNSFSCWPFFAPGAPTGKVCKGFRWEKGVMTALPAFPGGYNSYATAANNRGQIVGWAENGVHDPTCDPNFQTLQFRAAIWGPKGRCRSCRRCPATRPVPPRRSTTMAWWSGSRGTAESPSAASARDTRSCGKTACPGRSMTWEVIPGTPRPPSTTTVWSWAFPCRSIRRGP